MNEMNGICDDIFKARSSLTGLASLFLSQGSSVDLNEEELVGVGYLIKIVSDELENTEESLRSFL